MILGERTTGEYDPACVACCYVEITGKDGKEHAITADAASAYDAISLAIQAWSMLWCWDPATVAIVKRNDQTWTSQ